MGAQVKQWRFHIVISFRHCVLCWKQVTDSFKSSPAQSKLHGTYLHIQRFTFCLPLIIHCCTCFIVTFEYRLYMYNRHAAIFGFHLCTAVGGVCLILFSVCSPKLNRADSRSNSCVWLIIWSPELLIIWTFMNFKVHTFGSPCVSSLNKQGQYQMACGAHLTY